MKMKCAGIYDFNAGFSDFNFSLPPTRLHRFTSYSISHQIVCASCTTQVESILCDYLFMAKIRIAL